MMNTKPFLSIVVSQYNELLNLKHGSIDKICDYFSKQNYSWELIIVDDGSTDGSAEYAKTIVHPNLRYLPEKHRGKAGGLNAGISKALGEWILLIDADQSTPVSEIEKLLPCCSEFEAIIGSRMRKRENASLFRKLSSFIFSNFRKLFILRHINDTQCGFKLFKGRLLKQIFPMLEVIKNPSQSGWSVSAFDVELLFMFEKAGYIIKEVNTKWRDEDISNSKDKNKIFVKESLDMIMQILRTKWNAIRGKYENLVIK